MNESRYRACSSSPPQHRQAPTRRYDASPQLRRTNGSLAAATELLRDSMINVAALVTVDKDDLNELIGQVPDYLMQDVDRGPRQVPGV
jgi:mRNA-degrading endonuclease toxin of MazEF toxin-antitoxin module